MPPQRSDGLSEDGKRRNSGQSDHYESLPDLRKRKRLDDGDSKSDGYIQTYGAGGAGFVQPKKKLSHADYTIAWICALPLELKAARYMLDEEHEALPVAPSDENVYMLGSIEGHNVVMTSLRAGVYGLVSATAAGKDILATFPIVKSTPLLVGIGGGCPSPVHDIRLGDVVVSKPTSESPAIRQYDAGKIVHNGKLEIKGSNNKPAPILLNAVANLEAKHDSLGQQIQNHIMKACQKYGFVGEHPGVDLDILFEPGCEHINGAVCDMCGLLKPVSRDSRGSLYPEVHFGPIASGNQVVKDAITRRRLASEHGFLCFEMEAAGLMDFLPCLVIRGISDYCDSSKHKQFQPYAALTAAAFAKELISVLPKKITTVEQTEKPTADRLERRKLVMEALDFVEADRRKATIKKAHHQTCWWLFKQQGYINWREHWKVDRNNALLWIKGNPGTGKSTLMKFLLEDIEKHKSNNDVVVSFFFNARGESLERTTEGLYRSLVVQLLKRFPGLQWLLEKIPVIDRAGNMILDRVVELFRSILQAIRGMEIICLVDALDECSEQEIRDMLDEFVAVLDQPGTEPKFRILFSSRHYPHISIDVGQSFVLEKQEGHANDLTKYIQAELKIGKTKQADRIKQEVLDKANGIFLWVVLVVNILKRDHDRGRIHEMAQRLKEIPVKLDQLFREILLRDNNNVNELVLCIQWCLYSQRPLNREEFYFAMLAGNNSIPIEQWDKEEATAEIMDKFILDCSRGLAEMTRGKKPVIQFIHESVREFFLTPDTLSSIWSDYHDITQPGAQEMLRNCCYRLLTSDTLDSLYFSDEPNNWGDDVYWDSLRRLNKSFPFLDYAVYFVLHHAEKAEQTGRDQSQFIQDFCARRWLKLHNSVQRHRIRRMHDSRISVLIYIIREHLQRLIGVWLGTHSLLENDIKSLLWNCASDRGEDTTKWLLREHGKKILSQTGDLDSERFELFVGLLLDGFLSSYHTGFVSAQKKFATVYLPQWMWIHTVGEVDDTNIKELIEFAAAMKRSKALEFLLDTVHPPRQWLVPEFVQALLDSVLTIAGRRCYSLILSKPEKQTISKGSRGSSRANMFASLDTDTKACIEILISRGARVGGTDPQITILKWAGLDTIRFLLQQNSAWFLEEGFERARNMLDAAIRYDRAPTCLQLLIHYRAEGNAKDKQGEIALRSCAQISRRRFDIPNAQILINHGARVDGIEELRKSLLTNDEKLNKVTAMVPQTPCCALGIQTDTAPHLSGGDISLGSWTVKLEQPFDEGLSDEEDLRTASALTYTLDDWIPFEKWPEADRSLLSQPLDD